MTNTKRSLWIALLFFVFAGISAQNSQVMYYMNLPQNHLLNPALRSTSSFYIGFPGLTSVNANIDNNFVNFSDVFRTGSNQSDSTLAFINPDFDIDKFLSGLKDRNFIESELSLQLFGLGFKVGNGFYGFIDIIDRVEGSFVFPKSFFELAFRGNDQFIGSTADLSDLGMDLRYFREVGFGLSKDVTEKLRIGAKAKVLFGLASASLVTNKLSISPVDDFSHTFDTDMELNISGPVKITTDQENRLEDISFDESRFDTAAGLESLLTNTGNFGFGIDLGAEYRITDRLAVSAALTDIGFINWKKDLNTIYIKDQVEFSGLNMEEVHNGTVTMEEVFESIGDTLDNYMFVNNSPEAFKTVLPFNLTFGGKYDITKQVSVGLLSCSRFVGEKVRQSVTLSGNVNLWNAIMASLSYTASNSRYDNLGAGLSFRAGFFQIYAMADRIPVMWSKFSDSDGSHSMPANWNTMQARIGINFVFGNRMKNSD